MKRRFGHYSFEVVHRDKVFFPDPGITKGQVLDYYEKVASYLLPHLRDRPLTMERYPDGVADEGFIQKQRPDYFPHWLQAAQVETEKGPQTVPVCGNLASLMYVVNQGCVTAHVWLSRLDRRRKPDQMIFDLDPPGNSFAPVRQAAKDCLELLDELGLPVFIKTTGSRGLHLVVPLRRHEDFDAVREFATACARVLVARYPDRYTLEQRIAKRGGRLYLDVQRNAYGQTAVAPFSLRARAGAPVACPIDRSQLWDSSLHAQSYTLKNLFRSLSHKQNPWHDMRRRASGLAGARRVLEKLGSQAG